MTFWIISILMLITGLVMVLPRLLTGKTTTAKDNREQNISIAKERLAELENELEEGTLSRELYQQTLAELEKSLLVDIEDADNVAAKTRTTSGRLAAIALVIVVPLLSFLFYNMYGSPQHLAVKGPGQHPANIPTSAPATASATESPKETPSMEEMVSGLQKKIAENPADPNAWYLLGRLHAASGDFAASVAAYEKLVEVSDRQPTALVVLADSLAMTQDGSLAGRPVELINEALQKEPAHTTALWMAGQAAADNKQYLEAMDYWQQAANGLTDNEEMLGELTRMINEAAVLARQAGMQVPELALPETAPAVTINIDVSLAPSLQEQIQQNDVLFIFARAATGPPMPLAAVKRQAGDLPLNIMLDDSSLLRPDSSLSQYTELSITARISRSGQPVAQSGDLQSDAQLVKVEGSPAVQLIIDQVLP